MEFARTIFQRGGPIMWPLLVCSIISLTITIERLLFWLRGSLAGNPSVTDRLLDCTERGAFDDAMAAVDPASSAVARVLRAGLRHREHGLSEAMHIQAGEEIARMKGGLGVLDTIVTMAPLLGILGTVIGIIESFDLLGASGIEDPKAVTGGIAQALITTAAGLTVALITLIPLNYFVARVQRATTLLEQMATQLEVAYKRARGNADHAPE